MRDWDVCEVDHNRWTSQLFCILDDSALLIGCPDHEIGAIADRRAEGAVVVGKEANWLMLNVPQ
ncbi:MAG: hypothetical protein AAF826_09205 [Pseudomonadota bacterium]